MVRDDIQAEKKCTQKHTCYFWLYKIFAREMQNSTNMLRLNIITRKQLKIYAHSVDP